MVNISYLPVNRITMAAEIEKAKKQRKTIRYFTEDLKEVGHEDSLW